MLLCEFIDAPSISRSLIARFVGDPDRRLFPPRKASRDSYQRTEKKFPSKVATEKERETERETERERERERERKRKREGKRKVERERKGEGE